MHRRSINVELKEEKGGNGEEMSEMGEGKCGVWMGGFDVNREESLRHWELDSADIEKANSGRQKHKQVFTFWPLLVGGMIICKEQREQDRKLKESVGERR